MMAKWGGMTDARSEVPISLDVEATPSPPEELQAATAQSRAPETITVRALQSFMERSSSGCAEP
jgi:hypothetical protein